MKLGALGGATACRAAFGFALGGVTVLRNGGAVNYGERDGLPLATVNSIVTDHAGITYAATTRGLLELRGDRWLPVVFIAKNPDVRVSGVTVDRTGTM